MLSSEGTRIQSFSICWHRLSVKTALLNFKSVNWKRGIPGQQTSAKREMSPSWLLFCCDNTMKDNHAEVFCILDTIRLLHYTTQPFISYGSTTRKGKEGSTVKYFEKSNSINNLPLAYSGTWFTDILIVEGKRWASLLTWSKIVKLWFVEKAISIGHCPIGLLKYFNFIYTRSTSIALHASTEHYAFPSLAFPGIFFSSKK